MYAIGDGRGGAWSRATSSRLRRLYSWSLSAISVFLRLRGPSDPAHKPSKSFHLGYVFTLSSLESYVLAVYLKSLTCSHLSLNTSARFRAQMPFQTHSTRSELAKESVRNHAFPYINDVRDERAITVSFQVRCTFQL